MDGVVAATVCIRGGERANALVEMVVWDSADEACEALATLFDRPCSRRCRMNHFVLIYEPGDPFEQPCHVIGLPPAPPPPLDRELDALYPRDTNGDVHTWPVPREFNEPLNRPVVPSMTGTRVRNGQAVQLARLLAKVGL
jgi:hypothetical protein